MADDELPGIGDSGTPERSTRRFPSFRLAAAGVVVAGLSIGAGLMALQRSQASYRPELQPGESLGIDVSHFQGEIDWEAVAADDITFAYIKATEAGDWVDDTFAGNWADAREAGLTVGAYHFFTLCRTGADQAANSLRTVPLEEADFPHAVDLEFPNNCAARPPKQELLTELSEFLDLVEEATQSPVLLYVEDEFDELYGVLDAFPQPMWERSIRQRPPGHRWVIWQASDVADVNGIDDGVDLNLMGSDCCGG